MTIAAKGAVRKAVVSTLGRIGRGSCAEIERRGDIADGGSRAALWALHKDDLAHITAWERSTEKSAPAAVWVLGPGQNAPRPAPKPRASRGYVAKSSPFSDGERTADLPMEYPVKSAFVGGVNPWTGGVA